jgi:hypothetical protein
MKYFFIMLGSLFLIITSCTENQNTLDQSDIAIESLQNRSAIEYDKDQVISFLHELNDFDELIDFQVSFKEYGQTSYLAIEVIAFKEGLVQNFTSFPGYHYSDSGILVVGIDIDGTSERGCTMNCVADGCGECKQTINDPCKSQTCACTSDLGGNCNPTTIF